MTRYFAWMMCAMALGAFALLPGCGGTAEAPAKESTEAHDDHDHDHDDHVHEDDEHDHDHAEDDHDHDHDHGEDDHDHEHDHDHGDEHDHGEEDDHDHAHSHEAPRGGTLVALGDHVAHFEVLLDNDAGELTFYAMDGHVENPVRMSVESFDITVQIDDDAEPFALTVAAQESSLTGETVGDTSEFAVTSEQLQGLEEFSVLIPSVEIRGVAFEGIAFDFPEGNE